MAEPTDDRDLRRLAAGATTHGATAEGHEAPKVRVRERNGRTWLSIRNEFAMVEIGVDTDANGTRLVLRDTESGDQIALDPLELEALTRLHHTDFGPLILR